MDKIFLSDPKTKQNDKKSHKIQILVIKTLNAQSRKII